jgi:hypothetical protein
MKGEQLMENLDKITPAAPAAAKQKREKKTSPVMWKNLGVLFHINLKLTFKNKSGMSLGIVWVLIYAIFTIIGAFVPMEIAVVFTAIRIVVCTFFFAVFIALVCAYLFRSQHDKGVHNIELRAGIPSIQTFMMRILVAYAVIATYVSFTVVFSLLGMAGPSRKLFILFQLTPALANYFMGLFFLAIFAAWMSLAKMAAGVVLCIFTGIVMFIAPMINSMIGAFTAHSGKKPIEKTTEYKENHILGASMISEYMIKFLDVTNDSDLTSEIIDDSQFLDSVQRQVQDEEGTVQWFESSFNDGYNSGGEDDLDGINPMFNWLIQYGLPLYTSDGVAVGADDPDGLGGILTAFTDVATKLSTDEYADSRDIANNIEFWSEDNYGSNSSVREDDFDGFKENFISEIEILGKNKKFSDEKWNKDDNYLKLEALVSGLIDLLNTYRGAWEFKSSLTAMSGGNNVHAPFNVNTQYPGLDYQFNAYYKEGNNSYNLPENVSSIIQYSNTYNEYRAMIGALMTGFQDLRDPLFTIGISTKENGGRYSYSDKNTTLRKFINDSFGDYVGSLKLGTSLNLLNHFSYIMIGYDPDWTMDGKIAQTDAMVLYKKHISQYRDAQWIADAIDSTNKTDEELVKNDTAIIKAGSSNAKKYIWSYGGLIAGYLAFIILITYVGSLIHKKQSLI